MCANKKVEFSEINKKNIKERLRKGKKKTLNENIFYNIFFIVFLIKLIESSLPNFFKFYITIVFVKTLTS
jgi:hypothetical protein